MPPVSGQNPTGTSPKKNPAAIFKIFHQQPINTPRRLWKNSQFPKGEAEPGDAGGAFNEFTVLPLVRDDAGPRFSTA